MLDRGWTGAGLALALVERSWTGAELGLNRGRLPAAGSVRLEGRRCRGITTSLRGRGRHLLNRNGLESVRSMAEFQFIDTGHGQKS